MYSLQSVKMNEWKRDTLEQSSSGADPIYSANHVAGTGNQPYFNTPPGAGSPQVKIQNIKLYKKVRQSPFNRHSMYRHSMFESTRFSRLILAIKRNLHPRVCASAHATSPQEFIALEAIPEPVPGAVSNDSFPYDSSHS